MTHEIDDSSLPDVTRDVIDRLAGLLTETTRVGVLTGAGISAASGVSTFRGAGGLWNDHRAEDLATPEGFDRDPALVWQWYGERREKVRSCSPNPAHRALGALASRVGELRILTQNVDGLHARSLMEQGLDESVELVELHGSLWRMRCLECDREAEDLRRGPFAGQLPRCECKGLLRPAVVWFGESLPELALQRAHVIATRCDVFLVAGTSAVVYPAASYATLAQSRGAQVAEFNLEPTDQSTRFPMAIHAPAEQSLPWLIESIDASRPTPAKGAQ